MAHVPYRGGGPALNDVIPGRVDVYFGTMPSTLPLARAGQVRALAVTSIIRSTFAPELPTIAESGVPGYDVSAWYGLYVPARTPVEIVSNCIATLQLPSCIHRSNSGLEILRLSR
jgi:tripartite-type tricarboxylate transporter receptor subunit TctC